MAKKENKAADRVEKSSLDEIREDIDLVRQVKTGEKLPEPEKDQPAAPPVLKKAPDIVSVFEVRGDNQDENELYVNMLWENYSLDSGLSSFLGRSYASKKQLEEEWLAGGGVRLLLTINQKEVLAVGSISGMDRRQRTAELRYLLNQGASGKGLNKLAIRHFSAYAHARLGIQRLYIKLLETNRSTIEILEKMKWEKCGTLKGYGWSAGRILDCALLSVGSVEMMLYCQDLGDEGAEDGGEKGQEG